MEKSEKKQPMIRIRGANENNLKSVDLDIHATSLLFLPVFLVPENPLWRLIRSMQRDRGVIWSRFPPMPDSF